jgi:DNA-binding MarR family transcriptional regulator
MTVGSMGDSQKFARAAQAFARGLGRMGRERARAGDVTPQQAETLQLIAEKGALSTSVLASLLGIDPSTASRNLAGLERAGLISRKKATEDGRQTDVRLTPRGRRMAENVSTEAIHRLNGLMDRLPRGERQRVTEALEILARLVGEASV